jgi:hypothetical protein
LPERSNISLVPGVVALLIVMFVLGPIGLFLAGAIWSGLFGWMLVDETDERAEAQSSAS